MCAEMHSLTVTGKESLQNKMPGDSFYILCEFEERIENSLQACYLWFQKLIYVVHRRCLWKSWLLGAVSPKPGQGISFVIFRGPLCNRGHMIALTVKIVPDLLYFEVC